MNINTLPDLDTDVANAKTHLINVEHRAAQAIKNVEERKPTPILDIVHESLGDALANILEGEDLSTRDTDNLTGWMNSRALYLGRRTEAYNTELARVTRMHHRPVEAARNLLNTAIQTKDRMGNNPSADNPGTINKRTLRTALQNIGHVSSIRITDRSPGIRVTMTISDLEMSPISNGDYNPHTYPTIKLHPMRLSVTITPSADASANLELQLSSTAESQRVEAYGNRRLLHPHWILATNPCLGDFEAPVYMSAKTWDIPTIIRIIIQYLSGYDPEDSAGRYAFTWEEIEPRTAPAIPDAAEPPPVAPPTIPPELAQIYADYADTTGILTTGTRATITTNTASPIDVTTIAPPWVPIPTANTDGT